MNPTDDILRPVVPPGLNVGYLHTVSDVLDVLGAGLGPGTEDGHHPLLQQVAGLPLRLKCVILWNVDYLCSQLYAR